MRREAAKRPEERGNEEKGTVSLLVALSRTGQVDLYAPITMPTATLICRRAIEVPCSKEVEEDVKASPPAAAKPVREGKRDEVSSEASGYVASRVIRDRPLGTRRRTAVD